MTTIFNVVFKIWGVQMKSRAGKALETVNCFACLKYTLTVVVTVVIRACRQLIYNLRV
jgi:hypothetical protein